MRLIYNDIFLEHDTGSHPENIKRLLAFGALPQTKIMDGEKYLTPFHTSDYVERVKKSCRDKNYLDPDTAVSKESYRVACAAVGATIMAQKQNDFALVRPPGHHAYPDHSGGFCIFNNISIAVNRLVKQGKRVFILDFDSHLGDGTEDFFYRSDKVLYWSLHQKKAFPFKGEVDEIGHDQGKGYTINVPLPVGSGDDVYLKAIESLAPAVFQFKPDVVAVSAGFDGHYSDPLLNLNLSSNTYYKLGVWLKENFTKVFATLEGGYHLEHFPHCLNNFLSGMNNKPPAHKESLTESSIQIMEEMDFTLTRLAQHLKPYWKL